MATKITGFFFQNMTPHRVSQNKPASTRPTLTQRPCNDYPVLRVFSLLKVRNETILLAVSGIQQQNCPVSIKDTVSLMCNNSREVPMK